MELFHTLCIVVITSAFLIWLWLKNKYSYWKNKGVETIPYSYFFGSMKSAFIQSNSFADRVLYYYNTLKSKNVIHGGLYMMWLPVYMPLDVKVIKSIMQEDFQHFVDRGMYVNEKGDPLTAHLFNLEGRKWRLLRSKLTPTFTSGKLKMMFETLVDCTIGLNKVMDSELGNAVDIKDILGRFTTDIIGSCAFGLECNSLENPESEFRKKGKLLFELDRSGALKRFSMSLMPNLMRMINLKFISPAVTEFFMGVVKDTVAYREKNNVFRKDFMQLLIQLKNKGQLVDDEKMSSESLTVDENKITIEEIAAQAFIFFEAGFETSSTTMTFCLYELAKNKHIQSKVREEVKKVLMKYDGHLTYDAAMDMHYLEQTINETLRKYPPLAGLNRICTKKYKVPGTDVILEEGVRVLIPAMGIQRDPEFYPDPDKFDPDRFSEENKKSRPSFTFIPFGEGPRICIGARFGMMQTKVGLIALLLNYEFTVNNKMKDSIVFDPDAFITSTKGGMWLDFRKITLHTVELVAQK